MFVYKYLPVQRLNIVIDENGGFILADTSMYEDEYCFLCVYAPNGVAERNWFFTNLLPIVESCKHIIVLGDFNCVCYANYRSRVDAPTDRNEGFLEERIDDCCLVDVGY